jgi:hypothetical protein
VPQLAGKAFAGEVLQGALAVLQTLITTCTRAMIHDGRWLGDRLWLLDGTGFSMRDTPALRASFRQPGGQKMGCGLPVAHCLAMVHAATGLTSATTCHRAAAQPRHLARHTSARIPLGAKGLKEFRQQVCESIEMAVKNGPRTSEKR